jgi:hypothetical protein
MRIDVAPARARVLQAMVAETSEIYNANQITMEEMMIIFGTIISLTAPKKDLIGAMVGAVRDISNQQWDVHRGKPQ